VKAAAGQTSDRLNAVVADTYLNNIVKIDVNESSQAKGGYGFIFARQGDILWIATAAHVVYPNFPDQNSVVPTPYRDIEINTRGHAGAWPLAGAPQLGDGDLAFIPIRVPLSVTGYDAWVNKVVESYAKNGDPARLPVTPTAIEYQPWGGTIGHDEVGDLTVTGLVSGVEGDSGAPIFSGRGFVGMYIGSTGANVIPIEKIARSANAAGLRWMLTEFPKPSVPVHLCLALKGSLSAPEIRVSGETGMAPLDAGSCTDTRSGMVMIGSSTLFTSCSPQSVNLSDQPQQTIEVACDVALEGIWDGGPAGTLTFSTSEANSWRFEGLPSLPGGWIKGNAYMTGSTLKLLGVSQSGLPISGTLEVTERKLSGALLVGSQSTSLVLAR